MVEMYELIHCPFCGSTDIEERREGFNYKAAFWGLLFIHAFGILFGWFCRKRSICTCHECNNKFEYFE